MVLYVVKRPFRDVHGMVSAGSVIEPADIRHFKRRMLEGHIVEVNEDNFDKYAYFFKQKYGIDLQLKQTDKAEVKTEVKTEVKAEVKAEVKTEVKKIVVKTK